MLHFCLHFVCLLHSFTPRAQRWQVVCSASQRGKPLVHCKGPKQVSISVLYVDLERNNCWVIIRGRIHAAGYIQYLFENEWFSSFLRSKNITFMVVASSKFSLSECSVFTRVWGAADLMLHIVFIFIFDRGSLYIFFLPLSLFLFRVHMCYLSLVLPKKFSCL